MSLKVLWTEQLYERWGNCIVTEGEYFELKYKRALFVFVIVQ